MCLCTFFSFLVLNVPSPRVRKKNVGSDEHVGLIRPSCSNLDFNKKTLLSRGKKTRKQYLSSLPSEKKKPPSSITVTPDCARPHHPDTLRCRPLRCLPLRFRFRRWPLRSWLCRTRSLSHACMLISPLLVFVLYHAGLDHQIPGREWDGACFGYQTAV